MTSRSDSLDPDGPLDAGGHLDEIGFDASDDSVWEVLGALAMASTAPPPPALRASVLEAARRTPRRPAGAPDRLDPGEAYAAVVARLRTFLASLDDSDWQRAAVNGFDVHGMVAHMAAVEIWFATTLGLDPTLPPGAAPLPATAIGEHLEVTRECTAALIAGPPAAAVAAWSDAAGLVVDHVRRGGPALLGSDAAFYLTESSLAVVLIARMFELWTHEEDIRRATRRLLVAPVPAVLSLMTMVGVGALPTALARAGTPLPGIWARVVLTGAGGGAFSQALDGTAPTDGTPALLLVADGADLCRVVAGRLTPEALLGDPATYVEGERSLAVLVLAGATHLAVD